MFLFYFILFLTCFSLRSAESNDVARVLVQEKNPALQEAKKNSCRLEVIQQIPEFTLHFPYSSRFLCDLHLLSIHIVTAITVIQKYTDKDEDL